MVLIHSLELCAVLVLSQLQQEPVEEALLAHGRPAVALLLGVGPVVLVEVAALDEVLGVARVLQPLLPPLVHQVLPARQLPLPLVHRRRCRVQALVPVAGQPLQAPPEDGRPVRRQLLLVALGRREGVGGRATAEGLELAGRQELAAAAQDQEPVEVDGVVHVEVGDLRHVAGQQELGGPLEGLDRLAVGVPRDVHRAAAVQVLQAGGVEPALGVELVEERQPLVAVVHPAGRAAVLGLGAGGRVEGGVDAHALVVVAQGQLHRLLDAALAVVARALAGHVGDEQVVLLGVVAQQAVAHVALQELALLGHGEGLLHGLPDEGVALLRRLVRVPHAPAHPVLRAAGAQLAGLQVDDAVLAAEQVRVAVELHLPPDPRRVLPHVDHHPGVQAVHQVPHGGAALDVRDGPGQHLGPRLRLLHGAPLDLQVGLRRLAPPQQLLQQARQAGLHQLADVLGDDVAPAVVAEVQPALPRPDERGGRAQAELGGEDGDVGVVGERRLHERLELVVGLEAHDPGLAALAVGLDAEQLLEQAEGEPLVGVVEEVAAAAGAGPVGDEVEAALLGPRHHRVHEAQLAEEGLAGGEVVPELPAGLLGRRRQRACHWPLGPGRFGVEVRDEPGRRRRQVGHRARRSRPPVGPGAGGPRVRGGRHDEAVAGDPAVHARPDPPQRQPGPAGHAGVQAGRERLGQAEQVVAAARPALRDRHALRQPVRRRAGLHVADAVGEARGTVGEARGLTGVGVNAQHVRRRPRQQRQPVVVPADVGVVGGRRRARPLPPGARERQPLPVGGRVPGDPQRHRRVAQRGQAQRLVQDRRHARRAWRHGRCKRAAGVRGGQGSRGRGSGQGRGAGCRCGGGCGPLRQEGYSVGYPGSPGGRQGGLLFRADEGSLRGSVGLWHPDAGSPARATVVAVMCFFCLPVDVRSLIWRKARFLTAQQRLHIFLPRRVLWVPMGGSWLEESPIIIDVHHRLSQRKRMTLSKYMLPFANMELAYEVTVDRPHILVYLFPNVAGHVEVGLGDHYIEHRQTKAIGSTRWRTTHDGGQLMGH